MGLEGIELQRVISALRLQRNRPYGEAEYGLWHSENSSSEEDGGLAGRSPLPLPEMHNRTRNSKSTKLPSILQRPTLRPTVPPVEMEFDRSAQHAKTDKLDMIIGCLGTIADKGGEYDGRIKTF